MPSAEPTRSGSAEETDEDRGRRALEWAESFRAATDDDAELQAHGRFFTCSFLLDLDDCQVVVHMNRGKVDEIVIDPDPLDERYQFAIRASADTWRRFAMPTPPPMYHGIWAATFRADMRLEGDVLVLMQNLRVLTRQLELLRQTGLPLDGDSMLQSRGLEESTGAKADAQAQSGRK